MKVPHISLVLVALTGISLAGCASETATTPSSRPDTTNKRVHTQEELRKTGQSETGAALEKTDAAVRTTRP